MRPQAVALIPGFLGFDHRRGTTYFADRFVTGLRTRLEAKCGAPFFVVPVGTLPVSSLADRQEKLLSDLAKLDVKLGYPQWHLLGHSTGGLDAALLARTQRLERRPTGSIFSSAPLRFPRLVSVTTVSAPHYGTGLAISPVGMLVRRRFTVKGLEQALELAMDAFQRDDRISRLKFALPSLLHGSGFYRNFVNNALATDLDPSVAGALTRITENRRPDIPITSFATIAPAPDAYTKDRFFAALWRRTHDGGEIAPPVASFPTLSDENVISASPDLPAVDAGSNDAIVNTNRQVFLDGKEGSFGALIVGDHADVLGRYRRDDLLDGQPLDPGLLTSGATFGDDQFFAVLDRIAERIPCAVDGKKGLQAVA